MKTLVAGQRLKLADLTDAPGPFTLTVSLREPPPAPVLLLSFLLGADGALPDAAHLVSVERRDSPDGAVRVTDVAETAQTFAVNVAALPPRIEKVAFALAFDERAGFPAAHAGQLGEGRVTLGCGGRELAAYNFAGRDFSFEKAVLLGEFYRRENSWRFLANASGFYAGLGALLKHFGGPEDSGFAPPAAPAPPPPGAGTLPEGGLRLPADWPGRRPPANLPGDLLPAVGMVFVKTHSGDGAVGTGFAITPGGHLLTCWHVAADAAALAFRAEGDGRTRPARVVAGDERHDLALLWLEDGMGCEHWLLPAPPGQPPGLGQELGLLGYPLGTDLGEGVSYSQGVINGLRTRGGVPTLQIDTGAAPGSSGGPVYRRSDGRVVGVLQGGLPTGDRGMIINLALDLRAFWSLGWTGPPG